jgi:hypothetical protein
VYDSTLAERCAERWPALIGKTGRKSVYYNVTGRAGRIIAPVVCRRHLTSKVRVRSQASPYWIFGDQSGTGTGFFSDYFSVPRQYLLTGVPYSFIHLQPTVYLQNKHL